MECVDSLSGQLAEPLTQSCLEEPTSFGPLSDSENLAARAWLSSSTCKNVLKIWAELAAEGLKSHKRSWAAFNRSRGPEAGRGPLSETSPGMPGPVLREG